MAFLKSCVSVVPMSNVLVSNDTICACVTLQSSCKVLHLHNDVFVIMKIRSRE